MRNKLVAAALGRMPIDKPIRKAELMRMMPKGPLRDLFFYSGQFWASFGPAMIDGYVKIERANRQIVVTRIL